MLKAPVGAVEGLLQGIPLAGSRGGYEAHDGEAPVGIRDFSRTGLASPPEARIESRQAGPIEDLVVS